MGSLKKWILLIGVLVTAVAWWLLLRNQLAELQNYEWRLFSWKMALAVFLGAVYFTLLAVGWIILLRLMAKPSSHPTFTAGIYLWLVTMATRYIPGSIWHIVGRVAVANRIGVSKAIIISSASVEQVLVLIGSLSLVFLSLPMWFYPKGSPLDLREPLLYLIILTACLLGLHPRVLGRLLKLAGERLNRPEIQWNYKYRQVIYLCGIYLFASILAGLALYAVLWELEGVSAGDLPMVLGSAALAWVAGYLSFFTPTGLGVREGILTALLAQTYSLTGALIASLLFRLVCTLGELAALAIASGINYGKFHRLKFKDDI